MFVCLHACMCPQCSLAMKTCICASQWMVFTSLLHHACSWDETHVVRFLPSFLGSLSGWFDSRIQTPFKLKRIEWDYTLSLNIHQCISENRRSSPWKSQQCGQRTMSWNSRSHKPKQIFALEAYYIKYFVIVIESKYTGY